VEPTVKFHRLRMNLLYPIQTQVMTCRFSLF